MENNTSAQTKICDKLVARSEIVEAIKRISDYDKKISFEQQQIFMLLENAETDLQNKLSEIQRHKKILKLHCAAKYKAQDGAASELVKLLN